MSDEKSTRVFVGDSLSTTHLTKGLAGTWVEKGLSTQHMTSQLKVPTQAPSAGSDQSNAPAGQSEKK
jgi:hypothetical protein